MSPTPNEDSIRTALRSFLLQILPGVDAVRGQDNRVPEPQSPNFVVMTSIGRTRLATNWDGWADVEFTGSVAAPVPTQAVAEIIASISSGVMTVTDINPGGPFLRIGQIVAGPGIPAGVAIQSFGANTVGGLGSYVLTDPGLTVAAEQITAYLPVPSIMTVTAVAYGTIQPGATVFAAGAAVQPFGTMGTTGAGGIGTYALTPCQALSAGILSAGTEAITMSNELVFQLDVHGPDSADNATTINTAFRDEYATAWFGANAPAGLMVLHADDAKQIPFMNAENQWETRYVVDAHLQANQTIYIPQQFFTAGIVTPISMEATYPP